MNQWIWADQCPLSLPQIESAHLPLTLYLLQVNPQFSQYDENGDHVLDLAEFESLVEVLATAEGVPPPPYGLCGAVSHMRNTASRQALRGVCWTPFPAMSGT